MSAPRAVFSRDYLLLLAAVFGALSNYAPLLSVVPLWAAQGGAGGGAVGAVTGVMMGATVVTQLAMRPLLRALSLRRMVAVGALVMGLATPAYLLSTAIGPVLAVSALRGAGFALVVVAGAALVSELVADTHLSRGTGFFGLAAGLPNVAMLPLGVLVAQQVGFLPVVVGTTLLALVAVPLALGLSTDEPRGRQVRAVDLSSPPSPHPATPAPADPAPADPAPADPSEATTAPTLTVHPPLGPLVAPAVVFLATALGLGAALTFLPLAVPVAGTASVALLVLSVAMIVGRVGAGALGDGRGPGALLLPGVLLSGGGMLGVALAAGAAGSPWTASPTVTVLLAVVGAGLFGLGFGAVQNDSLVVILRRSGRGGHGTASTVWNIAYDGGTGLGAVIVGAVLVGTGYGWAFGATAVGILLVAPVARRLAVRSR
ncbi:MFS transporter [Actinotalea sp. BY-33]|uniref:MFS transporter n=1 Tax=Actinotalea soli TaxID=2819234 RepID=A0A939RWI9_9CELL|nr:MFS transporter [Actinotalea soli]MBO1752663.1 MFS transporter [Actinotalea soli]